MNEEVKTTKRADDTRQRPARKKVYERRDETQIPQEIVDLFAKDDWELKLIRWSIAGKEDLKNLGARDRDGYEFVSARELPDWYLKQISLSDTSTYKGLVTMGDLCLMKVDKDLRKSRQKYFENLAREELAAVDVNVLEKKGFKNLGTRSKVLQREPTFSD